MVKRHFIYGPSRAGKIVGISFLYAEAAFLTREQGSTATCKYCDQQLDHNNKREKDHLTKYLEYKAHLRKLTKIKTDQTGGNKPSYFKKLGPEDI
jgi:hypothetical protein